MEVRVKVKIAARLVVIVLIRSESLNEVVAERRKQIEQNLTAE